MPNFSDSSLSKLNTVDPRLIEVAHEVIKLVDFSVIEGHRGEKKQDQMFREGRSKLKWPASKHNRYPSLAIDVVPYPIDWLNRERFYYIAGMFIAIAAERGIKLRYGGDWDGDGLTDDQTFYDLPHLEIVE